MTAIKLYGQFLNHLLPMLASVSASAEDYFSIKLNQPLSFSLLLCSGTHFQRRNFWILLFNFMNIHQLVLYNGQDIIHCHDWSSAPVARLFKDHYMHYGLSKAQVVFTIHNLEFGAQLIGQAMLYSDKATTVSTYNFLRLFSLRTFYVIYTVLF